MNFILKQFYHINDFFNPKYLKKNLNIYNESKIKISDFYLPNTQHRSDKKKNIFMMGKSNISGILMQIPQILACLKNNNEIIIFLSTPTWSIQTAYKKLGIDKFIFFHQPLFGSNKVSEKLYLDFKNNNFKGEITYQNINILKLITSTMLRKEKKGNIDYRDKSKKSIIKYLASAIKSVDFAIKMIKLYKPEKFFFEDRGYLPDGIFFDVAINNKIDVIEFHAGHKSGILNYKRFNNRNKTQHPFSISKNYLNKLLKTDEINTSIKKAVIKELKDCYKNGEWYDEVGTSFFKEEISKEQFIKKYNLNPNLPIAIIFTHILYDATLFYGKDIFLNYEDWLIKTICYIKNVKNINWIIKCHPANEVKNIRDNKSFSEIDIIKSFFGTIPSYLKIIKSNSNESTLSLYNFIDCCLTVRGTVGIEAACFGIPVITAGTGRYDNLGFTIDSNSQTDYYLKLKNINNYKKYSEKKIDIAVNFAYAILISKQLKTNVIKFRYLKTKDAKLDVRINKSENLLDSEDVIKLSQWLKTKEEDLIN